MNERSKKGFFDDLPSFRMTLSWWPCQRQPHTCGVKWRIKAAPVRLPGADLSVHFPPRKMSVLGAGRRNGHISANSPKTHRERERERERCGDAPRGNAFRDPGDPTRVRPVLLLLCINSSCRRLQENVFLLFRHNLADCGVNRNKKTCSRHPLTRIKVAPRRREGVVSLVTFCKENAGQYPQQNFGIGANILHNVQMIGTGVQACRAASRMRHALKKRGECTLRAHIHVDVDDRLCGGGGGNCQAGRQAGRQADGQLAVSGHAAVRPSSRLGSALPNRPNQAVFIRA